MAGSAPPLRRVLETCLYVSDMDRAREFYRRILGLEPHMAEERISGFRFGGTMLLLFQARGTLEPVETPGGTIPPHDASGPAHFALSIGEGSAGEWRDWLEANEVEVESIVEWKGQGSTSLYFRDPDGHLVELATPGLWGIP